MYFHSLTFGNNEDIYASTDASTDALTCASTDALAHALACASAHTASDALACAPTHAATLPAHWRRPLRARRLGRGPLVLEVRGIVDGRRRRRLGGR